jgi:PAS domain S-box-containing protein
MNGIPKTGPPGGQGNRASEGELREMNEALLISSVHQHELAEQARKAEEAMRDSHARFEALFDASPIGMYLVDPELRIRLVSRTARPVFGEVGELIGRDFVEVIHILWPPETADEIVVRFRRTLETGEPYACPQFSEERYDRKVREYYDWQIHRIALLDGEYGVVCYFIDVAARVLAEQSLRASEVRYRRLFESAHDGILILDVATRRITDVNPFMLDLLDYPRDRFIGKELWEIGLFRDKQANQDAMQELHEKGSIRYEDMPLQDRNGRRHPVEIVANIYQEDHHPVIQCNIRDISERKRFEHEREAHLINEQSLRMEAEGANRAKDIFLATLSHEMRTPLSAIVGWMTILRGDDCKNVDLQEGLEVIDRNTKAQVQLIEEVLDVSRIVSGKLRLEIRPCELTEVISAGVDVVRPAAEARDIALDVRLDPSASRALCDPTRIQQVVWNLVSNAVKFTPRGGKVGVTLARDKSGLRIEVSDNGQGISPELLPFVFDRFRQADSSTRRKFGGLGLGLSIVKHIVEMHGGTVEARSAGEGRGSTFTAQLPIRAVRVDESGGESSVAGGRGDLEGADASGLPLVRLDGLRVLVVDDEADARRILVKVLQDAGAVVTAAASAAEAIEALPKVRPEVLVSDLGMPDEDGFDLIRQVRGRGHHPKDLPAVALTAFVHKDDQRQALLAGFQVHIPKPVDPHDLTVVIASLAGRTG